MSGSHSYPAGTALRLSPAVAEAPDQTHAALAVSQQVFSEDLLYSGTVLTEEQLRTGSEANPWECAWLVWNYQDDEHFYYLALKPNGWELEKRDPDYLGGQRFLATGSDVLFPIGTAYNFVIEQHGAEITISVDGVELTRFIDNEEPYTSGRIGIYTEDATVTIDNIWGTYVDDFQQYECGPLQDGSSIGDGWYVPYLGYGSGSIYSVNEEPPLPSYEAEPQKAWGEIQNIVSTKSSVTLEGTSLGCSVVEVMQGGELVATALVDSSGGWSVLLKASSKLAHEYTISYRDRAGNEVASQTAHVGSSGRDQLQGAEGDDFILGGGGNDILTGGGGSDVFSFHRSSGHDTITDFDLLTDKLNFADIFISREDLLSHSSLTQLGDVVIRWGSGANASSVTLTGVSLEALSALDYSL